VFSSFLKKRFWNLCYLLQPLLPHKQQQPFFSNREKVVLESISSTNYTQLFSLIFWCQKIAKPNIIREKLLNLLLYEKRARKILMKLTTDLSFSVAKINPELCQMRCKFFSIFFAKILSHFFLSVKLFFPSNLIRDAFEKLNWKES